MAAKKPSAEDCAVDSSRWEKTFQRIKMPIDEFIHDDTTSGLLLMGCTVLALFLANTELAPYYDHIRHTEISLHFGAFVLHHSIHHWINDGLMALFFFLVGLEIKREILVGELAVLRQALLPIAAAVGGMVVPALIYATINKGGMGINGWAIPMATDIAFALGALVLLRERVPKALFGFLLALAIVDDLGAVIVIALFYTQTIVWQALLLAALFFVLLIVSNLVGLRGPLPYAVLGSCLWLALLKSGVHATLAGVLTALAVPANSRCAPLKFSELMFDLLWRFEKIHDPEHSVMSNSEVHGVLQGLENGVHNMASPLQRLEHGLHTWSAFIILPLFALVNAGIPIEFSNLANDIKDPVTLGVVMGLVAGKCLGIFLSVWLLVKFGASPLPNGVALSHIVGVSLLAGIGFTMSIFIGELAFMGQPELLLNAKVGVLLSSVIAGASGFVWLYLVGNKGS
ncbi:MAG: Na+/H+ antiporter NhaA [Thermodesulfobacteriota bacterium]